MSELSKRLREHAARFNDVGTGHDLIEAANEIERLTPLAELTIETAILNDKLLQRLQAAREALRKALPHLDSIDDEYGADWSAEVVDVVRKALADSWDR